MEAVGRTVVLLVAYGGPDSLEDVEPFLHDVREGRPCPPDFLAAVRERYRIIGGRSPILERTREQALALADRLEQRAPGRYQVLVGMRHWKPRVEQVLAEAAGHGAARIIAIPMTPYGSRFSVGAYAERLREGLRNLPPTCPAPETVVLGSWNLQPHLLDAFEALSREALSASGGPGGTDVIFTAHSLPAQALEDGDPYPAQVQATAEALAARLGLDAWHLAYQSPGRTPQPWMGPFVEEVVERLSAQGRRDYLVAPIGFVCDHVEILYDIDVVLQEKARALGVALRRTRSPNDHPAFIAALETLVLEEDGLQPATGFVRRDILDAGPSPKGGGPSA